MLNLGRTSYQGYCQDANGVDGSIFDATYGSQTVEHCAVKCSARPECTAFGYNNNYCGLFKDGPYTSGDGDLDVTCYLMKEGI